MKIPNWYVITGGPSSGKTMVINELAKMGYLTFSETARSLIEKELAQGKTLKEIRKNEIEFQRKVLKLKLKIEEKAPKDKIVFFDRGLPDSIAYWKLWRQDPKEVLRLHQKKRYKKIFFLEQLPFEKNHVRIENRKTAKRLSRLLKESYKNLGYEVINIPVTSIKKRVQLILRKINKN